MIGGSAKIVHLLNCYTAIKRVFPFQGGPRPAAAGSSLVE